MEVNLKLDRNMRIIGSNNMGLETVFDSHPAVGGEDTAATPMEVMLQAMGACSFMDVLAILRKKKKKIDDLKVFLTGELATNYPKYFVKVHISYELKSPDAEIKDLDRAVELSQKTYCGASALFQKAGCEVTWETKILR
mgnify:FL=1